MVDLCFVVRCWILAGAFVCGVGCPMFCVCVCVCKRERGLSFVGVLLLFVSGLEFR